MVVVMVFIAGLFGLLVWQIAMYDKRDNLLLCYAMMGCFVVGYQCFAHSIITKGWTPGMTYGLIVGTAIWAGLAVWSWWETRSFWWLKRLLTYYVAGLPLMGVMFAW